MTPQEKAKELFDKFIQYAYDGASSSEENAQECALIAVEEILLIDYKDMSEDCFNEHIDFWQEVKKEIQAL